jgi:hypothetical protein
MRFSNILLISALCLALKPGLASAQSSERKCPVLLDHIDLSYGHQGGQSKPQLRVSFGNNAGKTITTVTFSLSVLDSGGYPHPYPDDLTYSDSLEAGKEKTYTWGLSPESVDIHRTGETVTVQEIGFADNTVWKNNEDSESCVLTVDFHPR